MREYSGWEYLLIDAANHYGHDKLLFEERIQWATDNLQILETLAAEAETKPQYLKAVMAIRKAQAGIPTGHLVGLDACCSGIQVMSALTGCIAGAESTGMIDPNVRADAYSRITKEMGNILGTSVNVSRDDAKAATMTSYYGSKKRPKDIFGDKTPELDAFYQAALVVAPGAWELLQDLLASWQPYALSHAWKLPDGYDARVKVMKKKEARIEVDELDHATFTYEFYENSGTRTGLSNAANLTHSMDAYALREMHRRCNYDREGAENVALLIQMTLLERSMAYGEWIPSQPTGKLLYYVQQYERSSMISSVIIPFIDEDAVKCLTTEHLQGLAGILETMLSHAPFELVTVHDEFRAHANNMNHVRYHYRESMAEIADSNVLDDLLSQLHGNLPGSFNKLSFNLGDQIRKSSYALC